MVAAWISAETGVGPSMASGSQVCSGTWADFANAPTSSRMQPATRSPSLRANSSGTRSNVFRKSSVPTCLKMKYVPSTRPTSPTTLMTNALMPACVAVRAAVPERDQQVGRGADERPADDQQQEVAGQDQQQHAEHEEVQVREEARVALVGRHVGGRVEVDQRRDAGHHQRHEDAQRVEQDRQLGVHADGLRVVPRRPRRWWRSSAPRSWSLKKREHRRDERERDGERADHAVDARGQRAPREADDDRARRAGTAGSASRSVQAHPWSSRSSSTSTGSLRR